MSDANRKPLVDAAESETLRMRGNSMHGNRETLETSSPQGEERSGKALCHTPDMHVFRESDGPIVPKKRANKAGPKAAAESVEQRRQVYVGEVPANFYGWVQQSRILLSGPKKSKKRGGRKQYPRLARRPPACEVQNLAKYSPLFREQSWQRYRIKDTTKGPEVWEIKWQVFWRKGENGLPGRRHCLIVARNVITKEVKYFVANRVPGERGITLRWLLRVAFNRWVVERCFRVAKDALGMDHYQVRGWRCVHRHFYLTQLTYLFCARIRQQYDKPDGEATDRLTIEGVRSAMSTWLTTADLKPAARLERYKKNENKGRYYQRRYKCATKSHTQTKIARFEKLGIDVEHIKSCKT